MTDPLDRIRTAALSLPETEERSDDGRPIFLVAGEMFARLDGTTLSVRQPDGEALDGIDVASDPDWPSIEDRIAASWELAAPRRLLEAGGR